VNKARAAGGAALLLVLALQASCEVKPDSPRTPSSDSAASSRSPRPSAPPDSGRNRNPILDRDFPDPTVVRTSSGWFYGYATQVVTDARTINIQVARSRDLLAWEHLGDALPSKPSWAQTTQDFWAPHVVERGGTFYMYFSAVPDDAQGADLTCLAVATSDTPAGPFQASEEPLLCSGGVDIDPMILHDRDRDAWFMYWAAAGDIVVQRLADDLVHLAPGFPELLLQGLSADVKRPYENIVEGPFVVHRKPWYFLFYSGDDCCSFPGHYAVLVARARRPMGPFERLGAATGKPSSVILSRSSRWSAPGHGSLVRDSKGNDWFAYHAIDSRRPYLPGGNVRRPMLLGRVTFRNGWPRIGAGKPSSRPIPRRAARPAAG
jgi:arabinan endo-1,5-alpha-L-arabinosidase